MRRSSFSLRARLLAVLLSFAVGVGSLASARADETVSAVWQVQEIHLPYFGLTTHYSCDGLRDKMREFMTQLGAREDFLVYVAGCTSITGPVRNPSVTMVLATAAPASDETTQALASDAKRSELLARMKSRSKSKAQFGDELFDAVIKRVTLQSKSSVSPGASGDCELLEQMRRHVLPKIGAKIVSDNVRCTPYQGTVGNPSMEVEVLIPSSPARAR
jgi:hypothetical protein